MRPVYKMSSSHKNEKGGMGGSLIVRHAANARHKGRKSPNYGHKACQDNSLPPMFPVEGLCLCYVLLWPQYNQAWKPNAMPAVTCASDVLTWF